MAQQTRKIHYDFRGHHLIPATASGAGTPFVKADTSAAGSPTVQGVTGGGVALTMTSTNEAQNLCFYMGDVLPYDIDELIRVEWIAKTVASLDSATQIAMGVTSARNDAIDSITEAALFRAIGNNTLVVESDDGTNDNNDVSTGSQTLDATWKRFAIDFSERVSTLEPPSVSTGGKSNVGFYVGNSLGSLRRVASGTRFDMSNYAGGLQFMFQIQKTADTNTDSLTILECTAEVKLPDYS